LGYHIVLNLLSRGCKVIVADRIVDDEIKQRIINITKSHEVYFEYVDLASFKSVRKLVDRIKKKEDKIDILINNAGIAMWFGPLSEDGLSVVMQVNYYSAFLMTHLLKDLLKKSPSARIMFTSSGLSFLAQFSESRFNNDETNDLEYNSSKFCIIAAADIFAEKFKKYNITSNSFHPGLVRTDMSRRVMDRQMSWPQFILGLFVFALTMVVGKTAEEGAQTAIHLACANEVDGVTGKFFAETVPTFKPGLAHDQSLCNAIWLHSERVVGLKEEEKLL
uniref:Retinol dehydrogenase 14-like n=1 Tax=Diabrotica virgifera virgifera TaxID=50390 RepID=A0A6P7FVT3_DIAVI